jgi:hypothetical protein
MTQVTASQTGPKRPTTGDSMEPMPATTPQHAKPATRDHLWVLAVIAAACGLEVCATWTGIGSRAGFPVIRLPYGIAKIPTDFCLMVCMEAYAYYALSIWLTRPGRRSGPFAMWSGLGAMALSLVGQVAYHVTGATAIPPQWLIGFVSALPVIALFFGAILAHFVRTDREETAAAEREAAEASELARLSAEVAAWKTAWRQAGAAAESAAAEELTALREQLEAAQAERDAAKGARETLRAEFTGALEATRAELAEALTRAENFAQKLAAKSAQPKRSRTAQAGRKNAQADDITLEFRALDELQKDPRLRAPRMGAELGRRIGASPATGRRLHAKLTAQERPGGSLTERSADQSGERPGERS